MEIPPTCRLAFKTKKKLRVSRQKLIWLGKNLSHTIIFGSFHIISKFQYQPATNDISRWPKENMCNCRCKKQALENLDWILNNRQFAQQICIYRDEKNVWITIIFSKTVKSIIHLKKSSMPFRCWCLVVRKCSDQTNGVTKKWYFFQKYWEFVLFALTNTNRVTCYNLKITLDLWQIADDGNILTLKVLVVYTRQLVIVKWKR